MATVGIAIAVWFVLGLPLSVLVGRAIRNADITLGFRTAESELDVRDL
ncbi:MAG TPA: hypothetical protein VM933_05905 [Acidimicrobiales bacterium]|nr:hypothetical protein [Acidimicrobiales bacterium]